MREKGLRNVRSGDAAALTWAYRVGCLLKYHRRVLAPTAGGLGANLYRVIHGRLETFERGGQLGRLNDGCISGVIVARVTPHCVSDIETIINPAAIAACSVVCSIRN